MKIRAHLIASLLFCFSALTVAQETENQTEATEEPEAPSWTGKGELGYVYASGNTSSETFNAGFELEKEDGNWHHLAKASAVRAKADEVTNTESYSAGWRTEYTMSPRTFVFGDLRYYDDQFDSFEEIYTIAAGFGYKVLRRENLRWNISAGVGYRTTEIDVDIASPTGEDEQDSLTYLLESDYRHTLTASTKLENYTRVEIADDNTFSQNVSGLSVKINSSLALKIQYDVRHNSDPEPGFTNTDKITSVNIVYSF